MSDTQVVIDYPAMPTTERFQRFHTAHPEVYDELVRLARAGVAAGRTTLGIGMLFEVVRWNRTIAGLPDRDEQGFKLNNNFRSRYARLIMACCPDLVDVFNTRTMQP